MKNYEEFDKESWSFFTGRGFVTFKNQDSAYFVKKVYNHCMRDFVFKTPMDKIFRMVSGLLRRNEKICFQDKVNEEKANTTASNKLELAGTELQKNKIIEKKAIENE